MVAAIVTFEQVQKKYYVYVLKYPQGYITKKGVDLSGVVFYVGKGTAVPPGKKAIERIDQHEAEALHGNHYGRHGTIQQIWSRGMQVQKEKVYETDIERDALLFEWVGINMIWATPHLMNMKNNVYHRERVINQNRQLVKEIITEPERTYIISSESQEILVELAHTKGMKPLEYLEQLIKSDSVACSLVSEALS